MSREINDAQTKVAEGDARPLALFQILALIVGTAMPEARQHGRQRISVHWAETFRPIKAGNPAHLEGDLRQETLLPVRNAAGCERE